MPFITAIFEAQRREPDVAIQVCTKLLELAPQGADWLALRGWAYLRKRDAAKALADLNRAVELKAEAMSHRSRGWVFFHNGDLAAAEADARKALSLNPNDLEPHLLLFRIRAARGERAKAIEEARRLLDALPTGSSGQAVGLLLRYLLGEVPLDTLRNHANWHNFEVVVRGHKQERD
jgi:tetratricopeptide (TPR) repeat protein